MSDRFQNTIFVVCFIILPVSLLIFFSTKLALDVIDATSGTGVVTLFKEEIRDKRVLYYEYKFEYNGSEYIGADSLEFKISHFSDARRFSNLTKIPIQFCKSDPTNNGFSEESDGRCIGIGWSIGIVMTSFVLLLVISAFVQNLLNFCSTKLSWRKKKVESTATPV